MNDDRTPHEPGSVAWWRAFVRALVATGPDRHWPKMRLLVIWRARVEDDKLACWQLVEDTPEAREQLGLTSAASPRPAP
jgi:hypothetical protein